MRSCLTLALVALIDQSAASSIDCSDAVPWKSTTYPVERAAMVHHDHKKYNNMYWAGPGDVPGTAGPWELIGDCIQGTDGEGPTTGKEVSCSGIQPWSGSHTYAVEGIKAHYLHKLFETKHWTAGSPPDSETEWTYLGDCISQTDDPSMGEDDTKLTPEKEALLCTCCSGCAKSLIVGPQCLDEVTSEASCYFTWCPKYNTKSEAACQDTKDKQKLHYYSGELAPGKASWPKRLYIPYIDGGLAWVPNISEMPARINTSHIILAFVTTGVSVTTEGCEGAYASVIPIKVGPTYWNPDKQGNDYLYSEVHKLREMGGDITISFGGANGKELADAAACQQGDAVANIKKAYKEVIDFVKLTHIDFDIEGEASGSTNRDKGWKYRFQAVKELSEEYPDMVVWWTLAILPQGLTLDGMNFIHDMMASGVRWDALNVMTMDYGDDITCLNNDMYQCEQDAITNLAQQVFDTAKELGLLTQYGWTKPEDTYPKLGSTPMLGMNDLTHEVYYLDDARRSLEVWKTTKPIGIISNWSLTRDYPCDLSYVSVDCSSINVQKEDYEFAKIFAEYNTLEGTSTVAPTQTTAHQTTATTHTVTSTAHTEPSTTHTVESTTHTVQSTAPQTNPPTTTTLATTHTTTFATQASVATPYQGNVATHQQTGEANGPSAASGAGKKCACYQ